MPVYQPSVPFIGPVVTSAGHVLTTRSLTEWAIFHDIDVDPAHLMMHQTDKLIDRAAREGQIVGLREDLLTCAPQRFGLSAEEAKDAAYHNPKRLVVIDPYTVDGDEIRCGHGYLSRFAVDRIGKKEVA